MRKCLCYYAYILDNEFGLLHVRILTWFPFTIQICMNGHDWLARRMDDAGIEYVQEDNCFTYISDYAKAQELADRFVKLKWVSKLNAFARRLNPLLKTELRRMEYYWCADQAEYATDIVFKDASFLNRLYGKLLNHAIIGLGAADILRFFGKKLDGRFKADQSSHCRKRNPGARVKHWLKNNWIKMYNKHGNVLRVETVVNRPYEFKILRKGKRNGEEITGWFPMGKAVGNLYRYAEVSRQANHAYLDTLAALDPKHQKLYEKNYRAFLDRIRQTDEAIRRTLAPLPPHSRFMVFHPAWGYFAREYGLEQLPVEVEGKAPKPRQLMKLIDEAKRLKVRAIFVQPEFSDKSAKLLAAELGIPVVRVSPMATDWSDNLLRLAQTVARGASR